MRALKIRDIHKNLNRINIYTTEISDGNIRLISEKGVGPVDVCRVRSVKPNEFFPYITIADGNITMDFSGIFVRSKKDSEEFKKILNDIWEFLDREEIKNVYMNQVKN